MTPTTATAACLALVLLSRASVPGHIVEPLTRAVPAIADAGGPQAVDCNPGALEYHAVWFGDSAGTVENVNGAGFSDLFVGAP